MIEVYWRTGLECAQPCAREIDLTKTEEELLKELNALKGDLPSSLNGNSNRARDAIAAA